MEISFLVERKSTNEIVYRFCIWVAVFRANPV
jgi:hypothetical protein